MTTYSTQNPLGSSDPRDLYDNAENLDNFVNGEQPAYGDRLGKSRKSWQAIEDEFAAFIAASGYEFVGDYAAGIELTGYQQILRDVSGEFWRVSGSTALPYTTSGVGLPEGGAFVAVGDAVLRQELAANAVAQGSDLIAHTGTTDTVTAALNKRTIYVGSVAELEALSLDAGVNVYLTQEGRAGEFVVKTGTPPSDPQKGIYIVLANGNYAMRRFDGITTRGGVSAGWYGVKPGIDSSAGAQAAMDSGYNVSFPPGTYTLKGVVCNKRVHISGAGRDRTFIKPDLLAGEACLTLNVDDSSISDMTIAHAGGYNTRLGTNIKLNTYRIKLKNLTTEYAEFGIWVDGASNFYHHYDNVRVHNSEFFTDGGEINNNSYKDCYFNKIYMGSGTAPTSMNNVVFYNCDFSTHYPDYGDKPFTFVNPSSLYFSALYSEVIDDTTTGVSANVFSFRREGTDNAAVPMGVTIDTPYMVAKGAFSTTAVEVDGLPLTVRDGFCRGSTNFAILKNDGHLTITGDPIGNYTGVSTLDPAGQTANLNVIAPTGVYIAGAGGEFSMLNDAPRHGIGIYSSGSGLFSDINQGAASNPVLKLLKQETTAEVEHLGLYSGQTKRGSLGLRQGDTYVRGDTAIRLLTNNAGLKVSGTVVSPTNDNLTSLGEPGFRWSEIFAGNGTINTSDEREKEQQRALSAAESRVATALKAQIKAFKWKAAVSKKGDSARWHFGVMAQEVISAFEAEGLNAFEYGMVCYDEWEAEVDADGIVTMDAGNRYGVRYDQLLAFIVSAI